MMRRNPAELRRIARSAMPTDARRPAGLRSSLGLTKFPNSSKALFENFVKPSGRYVPY